MTRTGEVRGKVASSGEPPAGGDEPRFRSRDASLLAEASRLLADSLDYETTLSRVAMLALPHLGSWCVVDLVEDQGIRRPAVVHPDPEKQELARELQNGWPPSREDPLGVPAVARTRRSEVISQEAILGYTQLLDMGVRGRLTDEQRELLHRVDRSSRHLLDLVTRVLDLSKAEAGELIVQNEIHLVSDVVATALKAVRPRLGERSIEVSRSDERLRFVGDGMGARQVLVSLLANAIRFSDDGSTITIRCELAESTVGHQLSEASGPRRVQGRRSQQSSRAPTPSSGSRWSSMAPSGTPWAGALTPCGGT